MGAFGPRRVAIPSDAHRRRRAALPDRRQSGQPARRHRPRLHRSGRHRLQPCARQDRGRKEYLRRHQGRQVDRPVHPPAGSTTMAAGTRPNISAAKATAPPAPPRSSTSSRAPITTSPSTASSSSRRCSISPPAPTRPGNEMTHVLNLPSMAATALYHGKAQAPSVEQFVEEARRFAIGPYARALLQGNALRARSARRSAASWRASPASPRPISSRPTCASRRRASTRNCCATAASPSAGSTPAIPAATMTMPARRPTTIPASSASTPAIPPRSTQHLREMLGFQTDRSYVDDRPGRAVGLAPRRRPRQRRLHERRALYRPRAPRE